MSADPRSATAARGAVPDREDARDVMRREVMEGLSRPQKELPPKYFYDTRGSELFEEITQLEEYYPTRTERTLLERWAEPWVRELRPASLVELGAGSARKSRIILDAMVARACGRLFIPMDVADEYLSATATRLRAEYPGLTVLPAVADFTKALSLPATPPEPAWYALLGSTLGNLEHDAAVGLLARVGRRLRPGDRFLVGADLRPGAGKTVQRLEAAYDDGRGVTAAFNLNVLRVLNRDLGTDFDLESFRHRAFYDPTHGRIEMHLVSLRPQLVRIPGERMIAFRCGETVRTEISNKYDRTTFDRMAGAAGLSVERWTEDADGLFALVMLTRGARGPAR